MRLEAIRSAYEALSRKDWAAVLPDVQPDFELRTPAGGLDPGSHTGREEISRAFAEFFAPYAEVAVEPEEFFEYGDRVVVFFLQRCRPKGSTGVVEVRAAHLWTMRDGKPARLEIFPERAKALEAAREPGS